MVLITPRKINLETTSDAVMNVSLLVLKLFLLNYCSQEKKYTCLKSLFNVYANGSESLWKHPAYNPTFYLHFVKVQIVFVDDNTRKSITLNICV